MIGDMILIVFLIFVNGVERSKETVMGVYDFGDPKQREWSDMVGAHSFAPLYSFLAHISYIIGIKMTLRIETIGDATLYNGDCCEVLETIQANSVKCLWTDPPYGNSNHDGDYNASLNKHRGLESSPILNDDFDSMRTVVNKMLLQAVRIMEQVSSCCCCVGGGGPRPTFAWLAERMDRDGLQFFHSFIWDKKNPGIGWRFRRQHEMVMIAHRADGKLGWADDNVQVPNIYSLMPPREREHPNEKPLMLMESFIEWMTLPGDFVCDPFMGSGSTGVASLKNGRKFIGIELDPKHFETAIRRITEASKETSLF